MSTKNAHTSFQVAAGVSVTAGIQGLIASGATENAIRQLVDQQAGKYLDKKSEDALVETLTSQVNISLLQYGATSASIALQAPGLNTQLTSNVNGLDGHDPRLSPKEVLADEGRREFLTSTLSGSVAGQDNQKIIDSSIQNVLDAGKIGNSNKFQKALEAELIKQGIAPKDAAGIAKQAGVIVHQQSQGSRVFHTDLLDRTGDINLLTQQLQKGQNLSEKDARTLATQAVDAVLQNKSISSDAEFSAALQIQLTSQGVGSSAKVAAHVVKGVSAATGEATPLEDPEPTKLLRRHELRIQLARHIAQLLAQPLGPDAARRHAQSIVEILVGTTGSNKSLLSLLDQNVARLLRVSDGKVSSVLNRSFRDFISPNIDAFVFNNKILDPANTFFLSAMTSTRLTDKQEPKNYIRYLEFYV